MFPTEEKPNPSIPDSPRVSTLKAEDGALREQLRAETTRSVVVLSRETHGLDTVGVSADADDAWTIRTAKEIHGALAPDSEVRILVEVVNKLNELRLIQLS